MKRRAMPPFPRPAPLRLPRRLPLRRSLQQQPVEDIEAGLQIVLRHDDEALEADRRDAAVEERDPAAQLGRQIELGANPQQPAAGVGRPPADAKGEIARLRSEAAGPCRLAIGRDADRLVEEGVAAAQAQHDVIKNAVAWRQRQRDLAAGMAGPGAPLLGVRPGAARAYFFAAREGLVAE